MLRIFTLIAILFIPSGFALAQPARNPHASWDVSATAGSFHGYPNDDLQSAYHEDWIHDPEGRLTVGRYWTSHLKTEVEFGMTGEADRFVQRFTTVPGSTTEYLYSAQDFFRIRQGSARVVWQFLDNQWIHPYVFAGVSVDEERRRTLVHDYRAGGRPPAHEGPRTSYRPGVLLGGGAKWYVSSRVFVKSAAQFGFARPASSLSFQIGMGVDF